MSTLPISDVIIAGGGPGGSQLAALLSRGNVKVTLFERDFFPREHIGESLNPKTTVCLEESGALEKVLASQCYVVKYGGWYAFDPDRDPYLLFFNHGKMVNDGFYRWTVHVNRSEFDKILLEHAKDCGAAIYEGIGVAGAEREGEFTRVTLENGEQQLCRIFVEASGRGQTLVGTKRKFISQYKNIAVWNHFVDAKPVVELDEKWNIFRDHSQKGPVFQAPWAIEHQRSAIGNFAFEDGWVWYIPVVKPVLGQRVVTHSVGIVTDVSVLKQKRYTDMAVFMDQIGKIPRLRELMAQAKPISDKVLTAQNYSMMDAEFCNYEQGFMLVGDSAFFVDPLFSTGLGNAQWMARHAAFIIKQTLSSSLADADKADLWHDYRYFWQSVGLTFGIAVDQWYQSIQRNFPTSGYWHSHRQVPAFDLRNQVFSSLVDLSFLDRANIADVFANYEYWKEVVQKGETFSALSAVRGGQAEDATVSLSKERVRIREGLQIWQGNHHDWPGEYWRDLPNTRSAKHLPILDVRKCCRLYFAERPNDVHVTFPGADTPDNPVRKLYELLTQGPQRLSSLQATLSPPQQDALSALWKRGFLQTT